MVSVRWNLFDPNTKTPKQRQATGRDVKHCAGLCEREAAIAYL